ncbi:hypothetical protein [Celeribacter sp.]
MASVLESDVQRDLGIRIANGLVMVSLGLLMLLAPLPVKTEAAPDWRLRR